MQRLGKDAEFLGYIGAMFEVLVFVYENYWRGDACPQRDSLERKLSAVGFEDEEIQEALTWLGDLKAATLGTEQSPRSNAQRDVAPPSQTCLHQPSPNSMRIYSTREQAHLGAACISFIRFLEQLGVLPIPMREIVLDRALATSSDPVSLDDLKIIVLMVYWSFGEEPDALLLDELCDSSATRVAH